MTSPEESHILYRAQQYTDKQESEKTLNKLKQDGVKYLLFFNNGDIIAEFTDYEYSSLESFEEFKLDSPLVLEILTLSRRKGGKITLAT